MTTPMMMLFKPSRAELRRDKDISRFLLCDNSAPVQNSSRKSSSWKRTATTRRKQGQDGTGRDGEKEKRRKKVTEIKSRIGVIRRTRIRELQKVGRSVGRSVGRLVGRLVGWLVACFVGWSLSCSAFAADIESTAFDRKPQHSLPRLQQTNGFNKLDPTSERASD